MLIIDPPVCPLSPRAELAAWVAELEDWVAGLEPVTDPSDAAAIAEALDEARAWLAAAA